jgi:hypothetical protein
VKEDLSLYAGYVAGASFPVPHGRFSIFPHFFRREENLHQGAATEGSEVDVQ